MRQNEMAIIKTFSYIQTNTYNSGEMVFYIHTRIRESVQCVYTQYYCTTLWLNKEYVNECEFSWHTYMHKLK